MDASALRQRVLAHNLANVETPGYQRFDVVFEEELAARQAAETRRRVAPVKTHPRHLAPADPAPVRPEVRRDASTIVRNDRSNVDVDREVAGLAKNYVWYQALVRVAGAQIKALRTAISEGRR